MPAVLLDNSIALRYNNKARKLRPWLSWIERLATDQKVGGSNPSGRANTKSIRLRMLFVLLADIGIRRAEMQTCR